jgi:hypothetical protein
LNTLIGAFTFDAFINSVLHKNKQSDETYKLAYKEHRSLPGSVPRFAAYSMVDHASSTNFSQVYLLSGQFPQENPKGPKHHRKEPISLAPADVCILLPQAFGKLQ